MRIVKKIIKIVFAFFMALILIAALKACFTDSDSTSSSYSTPENTSPVWSGTAKDIQCEYERNEVSADAGFKGQWVSITARVDKISKSFTDEPYLVLKADCGNMFMRPQAHMNDGQIQWLSSLNENDKISLRCKVGGMMVGSVMFKNCTPE